MPIVRCPYCAQRVVIDGPVAGEIIGCSRCEQTFIAVPQSPAHRLGELLLVAAALAVGLIVGWLILRTRT
jgi:hypothetical protein